MFEIDQVIEDYGIHIKNCLSAEDIDFIVSSSKDPSLDDGDQRAVFYVNAGLDRSEKGIEIFNKVHPAIEKAMEVYTNHFKENILDYTLAEKTYMIKTWKIGIGIGDHSDSWEPKDGELVPYVTVVLYLSSDYEGGELLFVDLDSPIRAASCSIKPSAGDILVFKSDIIHRVNPVISGTRIATDIFYLK